MISSGFNAPMSSSCGRLFDAVAGILGIAFDAISYEGQAAIELENLFGMHDLQRVEPYPFALVDGEPGEIDPAPMWQALIDDLASGRDSASISAAFHAGLGRAVAEFAQRLASGRGVDTVALSGGVFQNQSLLEVCVEGLRRHGLQVMIHRQVPANDGGLALGQAVVAAHRTLAR